MQARVWSCFVFYYISLRDVSVSRYQKGRRWRWSACSLCIVHIRISIKDVLFLSPESGRHITRVVEIRWVSGLAGNNQSSFMFHSPKRTGRISRSMIQRQVSSSSNPPPNTQIQNAHGLPSNQHLSNPLFLPQFPPPPLRHSAKQQPTPLPLNRLPRF